MLLLEHFSVFFYSACYINFYSRSIQHLRMKLWADSNLKFKLQKKLILIRKITRIRAWKTILEIIY